MGLNEDWAKNAALALIFLVAYIGAMIVLGFYLDVGLAVLKGIPMFLAAAFLLAGGAAGATVLERSNPWWLFFLPAAFLATQPLLLAKGTKFTPFAEIRGFEPDLEWYASSWFLWLAFLLLLAIAIYPNWRNSRHW